MSTCRHVALGVDSQSPNQEAPRHAFRIDFTRAFRNDKNLRAPNDLVQCDRQLLEHIKTLKADELAAKTHGYLTKDQVQGVMARRDKIVERFNQLVKEKGENAVLY
jgi:hypothetical protein